MKLSFMRECYIALNVTSLNIKEYLSTNSTIFVADNANIKKKVGIVVTFEILISFFNDATVTLSKFGI